MKRCPQCEVIKSLDQFPPRKDRPSGRMSRCHECDRAKARQYYARNRERVLIRTTEAAKKRYQSDRAAAIEVYGGRCARCGSVDELEFDHLEDDGGEHRQVEAHQAMFRRIAQTGRPITDRRLRLLCRDCHRGHGWKLRRPELRELV